VGQLLAAGFLDDVVQQAVADVAVLKGASGRQSRCPVLLGFLARDGEGVTRILILGVRIPPVGLVVGELPAGVFIAAD
jgi:hypothetical protein